MPIETSQALLWALTQPYVDFDGNVNPVTKITIQPLVDKVREYFNTNKITYTTFSYDDLKPYL